MPVARIVAAGMLQSELEARMYIKINEDGTTQYPYTIAMFRADAGNVTFPPEIGNSVLAEYGVYPVHVTRAPYHYEKNYVSNGVENINGQWITQWREESATEEQIAERFADKLRQVRRERNELLLLSDWTQLPDSPLGEASRSLWANYRQALRDITEGNPFEVLFPDAP
ncbi:Phage tail assembly chaperone protein [uncultured Caudovirales phage]|uniref:Phage tail assembly chaperone protein n=1 Tax=uncultured Caudovirales phage TaxID=2100421 RepID=A0A6J5SUG9_9CAUD|nr:Phage tail assembly chaperone protein [uncultured Caudovirales phage]CAB4200351.1 Phage tail assembly chaperone protein [uncultured Caudovirales phage]CAB4218716.1 Phage tail assembly chaperone protein [uncultured Caudovirales phage]